MVGQDNLILALRKLGSSTFPEKGEALKIFGGSKLRPLNRMSRIIEGANLAPPIKKGI